MKEVNAILKKIQETSSRTAKEEILKRNEGNKLLKEVFQFLYCDLITTGISKAKLNKKIATVRDKKEISNLMDYLQDNNTGSDVDIWNTQNFISQQDEELHEFYKGIATKNIKIGITKGTLNKVYGKGFIEDFKVMLADRYDKHGEKVKSFIITEKKDGVRCVLQKKNGIVTLRSRQGKEMTGYHQILEEASNLPDNMIYDGELVLINDEGLNSADLFRKTMTVVSTKGVKSNIVFHVFDMLPIEEFQDGKSKLVAVDRKKILSDTVQGMTFIQEVPVLYIGSDHEEINNWLLEMESQGKEGVMVNEVNSYYECKRSRKLLKVKSFFTVDLEIIGFEEGTNKYEGMLGKVVVLYKGHEVRVGSGFTDEERKTLWNSQEEYMGRVCEVSYFEESTNQKDDSLSLRFGTWKGLREQGKEVSYS